MEPGSHGLPSPEFLNKMDSLLKLQRHSLITSQNVTLPQAGVLDWISLLPDCGHRD